MKHVYSLLVSVLLLCCASPSPAAEFEYFTTTVPARWKANHEGAAVVFQAQGNVCMVIVLARKVEAVDPVSLAQDNAKDMEALGSLCALSPARRGFIFTAENQRYWLTTAKGMVFRISVEAKSGKTPAEVLALLNSIAPHPERPLLAGAIAALRSSPDIVQWLAGTGPAPAGTPVQAAPASGLPNFADFGNRKGENNPIPTMSTLPAGWTAATSGQWAVATSADKQHVIALRTYALAKQDTALDDGWPLKATARELAALLGGSNIRSGEGNMEFFSPEGSFILNPKQGNTTQILFFNCDDALNAWMGYN